MKLRAEAKLNLTLEVGARRADGYHDVDTVMHSISLCDVVTLGVLDSIEVTCAGLDSDAQDNIAYKAARAFFARAGCPAARGSTSLRASPVGAGLGGGSADAAAVLRGLNALYGRPRTRRRCSSWPPASARTSPSACSAARPAVGA